MKELIKSVSAKEWRFVILISLVLILLTTIPYLIGFFSADEGFTYNGLHALSAGDIPVYFSYISQVKEGNFFVKDLFTGEPQEIGTFNVWWTIVGLMARFLNISPILAFHLSRVIITPIFIFVLYLFLVYFFDDYKKRKLSLFFLFFSAGIGAYFAVFYNNADSLLSVPYRWPMDLWWTESIIFMTVYQTSHFIASITSTLLIFLLLLLAFEKNRISYVFFAGVLALVHLNFHPYYLPIIFGVPGIYFFVLMLKRKKFLWLPTFYLLVAFILGMPSVIYHLWLIKSSPVIGFRALQNVTLSSAPIFLLIGYGFLVVGFLAGFVVIIKNKKWNDKFTFIIVWLLLNIIFLYLPISFQSRYTQGIQLILVIFTVSFLFELYDFLKSRMSNKLFDFWVKNPVLLIFLFIILFCGSTLFNILRDCHYFIEKPNDVREFFYFPNDIFSAMDWLKDQSDQGVVISSCMPSYFVPSLSGHQVYYAHFQETLFPQSKLNYLNWFFKTDNQSEAKYKFLINQNINYVFYTDYEKNLGSFDPSTKNYLKLVFGLPKAKIYQVIKNQ